jgi:hypothetical protein
MPMSGSDISILPVKRLLHRFLVKTTWSVVPIPRTYCIDKWCIGAAIRFVVFLGLMKILFLFSTIHYCRTDKKVTYGLSLL